MNLHQRLDHIRAACQAAEATWAEQLAAIPAGRLRSAHNLCHFDALVDQLTDELQTQLESAGLAPLERAPEAVLPRLDALSGLLSGEPPREPVADATRRRNAEELLGPQEGRSRIMVTLPPEAATDAAFVESLVSAGMTLARINCAQDDERIWAAMIGQVRGAEQRTGKACRILMDIAGPKVRTGPISSSSKQLHWSPQRDQRGVVLNPALICITPAGRDVKAPKKAAVTLPVDPALFVQIRPDDVLQLAGRELRIEQVTHEWCWAQSSDDTVVEEGAKVRLLRSGSAVAQTRMEGIAEIDMPLVLRLGDRLRITGDGAPGAPARYDVKGTLLVPARVSCTIPDVLRDVRAGERIWFDDARIGAIVLRSTPEGLECEITRALPEGSRLRSDKGINLPDTDVSLPVLTPKDERDVAYAAQVADIVCFSFVRRASDIVVLQRRLAGSPAGLVVKIEKRPALEALPAILLAMMRERRPVGTLIARGDLAAEVGFEGLADAQQLILRTSHAAHVPVIVATQILDSLTKKGTPARAEVIDAIAALEADCIMLNRGLHVVAATRFLHELLMRPHPMLR